MPAKTVIVTGDKELDAKLGGLSPKLQKKFTRQALRKSGKRVLTKFRAIVQTEAFETGALMDSASVRAMKRSRTRLGVTIFIDRKKLFRLRQARLNKVARKEAIANLKSQGVKAKDAKRLTSNVTAPVRTDDANYYPAFMEFGTPTIAAKKPQRRALYENKAKTLADFRSDMQELVRGQ